MPSITSLTVLLSLQSSVVSAAWPHLATPVIYTMDPVLCQGQSKLSFSEFMAALQNNHRGKFAHKFVPVH